MRDYDPVQEYLDRLRSMSPSENLLHQIDDLERKHREKLENEQQKRVKTGFRSNAEQ